MDIWARGAFIVLAVYVAVVIVTMFVGRRSPPVDDCVGAVVVGLGPTEEPHVLNARLAGLRGEIVVIDAGDEMASNTIARSLARDRRAVTVVRADAQDIDGIRYMCSLMDSRRCLSIFSTMPPGGPVPQCPGITAKVDGGSDRYQGRSGVPL